MPQINLNIQDNSSDENNDDTQDMIIEVLPEEEFSHQNTPRHRKLSPKEERNFFSFKNYGSNLKRISPD